MHCKFLSCIHLWLATILLCVSAPTLSQTNGAWFTRAPLPTPRQEIPHAVLQGKIYVPGGLRSGGVATNTIEVFEPVTNQWSTAPSLPLMMHHLHFAAANGRLYVLGGYSGNSFAATARVFEFNFAANSWSEKMAMPAARGAGVAVAYGEKIYVIGGVSSSGTVINTAQVFDPLANNWQTLASMPTPREHLAAAVIDSLIYVIGGRNFSAIGNTARLEAYSPATNRWYTLASMPTARGGLAAAALHGKLYVFGGEIPGVFDDVEEYDPRSNTWRSLPPMPAPRHGVGAVTVGDTIFIIGGALQEGLGVSSITSGFTISAPSEVAETERELPRTYTLLQNYPNPFNASTLIRFGVPQPSHVTLKIFNAIGQEKATLVDGQVAAGWHAVSWHAAEAPSGVYFCRFQSGEVTQTMKLILLR